MNREPSAKKAFPCYTLESAWISSTTASDGAFSTTITLSLSLIFHVVELKIPLLEMNDIYSNSARYFQPLNVHCNVCRLSFIATKGGHKKVAHKQSGQRVWPIFVWIQKTWMHGWWMWKQIKYDFIPLNNCKSIHYSLTEGEVKQPKQ